MQEVPRIYTNPRPPELGGSVSHAGSVTTGPFWQPLAVTTPSLAVPFMNTPSGCLRLPNCYGMFSFSI